MQESFYCATGTMVDNCCYFWAIREHWLGQEVFFHKQRIKKTLAAPYTLTPVIGFYSQDINLWAFESFVAFLHHAIIVSLTLWHFLQLGLLQCHKTSQWVARLGVRQMMTKRIITPILSRWLGLIVKRQGQQGSSTEPTAICHVPSRLVPYQTRLWSPRQP